MSTNDENWVKEIRATHDYREFVGPTDEYDTNAAMQFNVLTSLGLREHHNLLDIGCGALRGARLSMMYLAPGNYHGIEPEKWLVDEAIKQEVGEEIIKMKAPSFDHNSEFDCSVFSEEFDFIICQGVFTHAPEWMIRNGISEAAKVLKPTGIFAASYFAGEENYTGQDWLYPKTSAYTEERMDEIVQAAGLTSFPLEVPHPRKAKWIVMCKPGYEQEVREASMSVAQKELLRLRSHPYVKFGLFLKRVFSRSHS